MGFHRRHGTRDVKRAVAPPLPKGATTIERIVASRGEKLFVKWLDLEYSDGTWESVKEINQRKKTRRERDVKEITINFKFSFLLCFFFPRSRI